MVKSTGPSRTPPAVAAFIQGQGFSDARKTAAQIDSKRMTRRIRPF
jgi:hypothetical protein